MQVRISNEQDTVYAELLCEWYAESAKQRKVGIAKRDPEYIKEKMRLGDSVIAFDDQGELAGFSYIEKYDDEKFVVNSGLIVRTDLRSSGIGKEIKYNMFALSRTKYPNSKIFSITTSLAVMKMNTALGYKPVTFSELTQSEKFWNGCKGCKNYSILMENERKMCLCTGLVYDKLDDEFSNPKKKENKLNKYTSFKRLFSKSLKKIPIF